MIKFITTAIMSLTIATGANAEDALVDCAAPYIYEVMGEPTTKHEVAKRILAVDPVRFIEEINTCAIKDDPENPFVGLMGPFLYGALTNDANEMLKQEDEMLSEEEMQKFSDMKKADLD